MKATIDLSSLTGSPSCTALQADAVVAQFGQFGAQAYEVYSATPTDVTYAGDAFSATFTADVYGADRVRAYGMVPDQTDLDGPVWLQRQPGSVN
jgi:hypothetical protein